MRVAFTDNVKTGTGSPGRRGGFLVWSSGEPDGTTGAANAQLSAQESFFL
jgi:hypothetical protein